MRVKVDYGNGTSIGTEEGGYLNPLSQSQSGPIVVFIPPIRGGMAGYTILIKAIKDRARLFGCLYPDVFHDLCPDLIENLGALYARAVAAAGFAERVNLVGWSMGALVAYECARNLADLGLTPARLVLVDPSPIEGNIADLASGASEDSERYFWNAYLSFKLYPPERERVLDCGRFWNLDTDARFASIEQNDPGYSPPFSEFCDKVDIRWEYSFVRSCLAAMSNFSVGTYPGECDIICCDQYIDSTNRIWPEERVLNRQVHPIQGDHNSIMFFHSVKPIRDILGLGGTGLQVAHPMRRSA